MISSHKKSYAEQLLKLVLALSLLRTDPDQYLNEWSGLESRHSRGNVGILELRAAPDYPYVNRKAVMPLIEDLARLDPVPFDVQAYLFTHSSSFPQLASDPPENQTTTSGRPNSTATIEQPNDLIASATRSTDEIFLNADIFAESTSVLEQSLADLNDFEGAASPNIYQNLKEEPNDPNTSVFDLFKCERAGASCDDAVYGTMTAPSPDDDEDDGGLGGIVQWDEYFGIKQDIDESALMVKLEAESLNEIEVQLNSTDPEIDNDPVTVMRRDPVAAELSQEVSQNSN